MSRRNNKNSATNKGGPPPSHPLEMNPEHRKFLIRSLDRCDTEFAALVKLNRSLTKAKQELIDICNGSESLLLDLGDGTIRLNATGDGLEGPELAYDTQMLCLDFLSRRKLRRRLLNRLSRRLQRLAHSLDGKDITPPFPPKYGDVRMVIEPQAIAKFRTELKEKGEAKERIRLKLEENEESKGGVEQEDSKPNNVTEEDSETKDSKQEDVEMKDVAAEEDTDKVASASDGTAIPAEPTASATVSSSATETEPTPVDSSDTKLQEKEASSNLAPPEQEFSSATKLSEEAAPLLNPDHAMIREFNNAYDKTLNLTTGEITYNLLNTPAPDMVPASIGIGGRHMTPQEKEAELKRWQTSVLMKIADQPTAKELGFENRVFNLEERRRVAKEKEEEGRKSNTSEDGRDEKVAKEIEGSDSEKDDASDEEIAKETEEDSDEEAEKGEKVKNEEAEEENAKSENDSMEEDEKAQVDEEDGEEKKEESEDNGDEKVEEKETKEESKDNAMETNSTEETGDGNEADEDAKKKNAELEPPPKCIKPMSLTPFPSFYNQDLRRIRLIHADLMSTSLHQHVRRRIAEVTHDYNRAYQTSLDICVKRNKFQNELNQLSHTHRLDLEKLKNDYAMQVSLARNQYQKRKEAWELQNAKKHSMYAPIGTPRTTQAARHPNHVYNNVGVALGRVIDAVAMKFEGNSDSFEPFVQPPAPKFDTIIVGNGETFSQRAQRVEVAGRRDLQTLNSKLSQAEDDRRRAWRKLCKTKSEFERARADAPLPPLRVNASITTPANIATPVVLPPQAQQQAVASAPYSAAIAVAANVQTMVPMQAPTATWDASSPLNKYAITHPSQSKYSAAKVRERIASDGTVKPVTLPKRDKDGLFLRPAGRTRKGMSWDAIRGMWVPQH
mmetsp:Transcript_28636/g.42339  ORF Transcript_28636/g.42339 Transcript_28636/m.42339 type:complete len:898 (+) Transcript_28636:174-2867(+)